MMTAHLLVPRWDTLPATLSRVALHGWLRQQLGFQGIIITDDLEMGAIARQQPVPQAARQALAAGADLLLICQDWQAAWETGRLLAGDHSLLSRGQEAARRLARLRNSLPWPDDQPEAVTAYFQQMKK
jgi:beta-glucosidase-like glycosyl hydrolase